MRWFDLKRVLTVDDMVESGACRAGVLEWLEAKSPFSTSIPTETALALCGRNKANRKYVAEAARLSGSGYGDGDGDGYGSGYGYGSGDGDGSGDG